MRTIHITSQDELPDVARAVIRSLGRRTVVAFRGEMGAGKTTLIREIVAALGSADTVTSPTFAIVNQYKAGKERIHHFDFYRIDDQREAYDFGYEEYFYSGDLCLVEWPEKIEQLLPENTMNVRITADSDTARTFEIDCPAAAGRQAEIAEKSLSLPPLSIHAMQEYISQQHRVLLPAEQIYAVISRFDNLTPALADRVEEWRADEERCSFKAKGFTVKLRMEERIEPKHVKIVGDEGGVPMDFAFWIQLHKVSEYDTRLRLVLRIELNMMMKMMIGGKLQGAIDQIAEGIARAMQAQA